MYDFSTACKRRVKSIAVANLQEMNVT